MQLEQIMNQGKGNQSESPKEDREPTVPEYCGIGGDELRNYGSEGIEDRDRFFLELGMQVSENSTILDVGCGSADISIEIARGNPHPNFICTDYERKNLEIARKAVAVAGVADRFKFLHCSADAVPLNDESVDLAMACSVIPYCDYPIPAIRQFFQIVRPGGFIAFDVTSEQYRPPAELDHIDWVHAFHYFSPVEMDEVAGMG